MTLTKGEWFEEQEDDFPIYEEDNKTITLRDWQRRGKKYFFKHNGKAIFEACTGSGKTFFMIDILQDLLNKEPDLKILIVVPKNIILETGWYKELAEAGIPIQKIGVYYGDIKEYSQITLTNMQSIHKIPIEMFDCRIFDECFTGDTKVYLMHKNKSIKNEKGMISQASIKGIVDQKSKGPVISFNTETKIFELKKVTNWYKIPNRKQLIKFDFENGVQITVTPEQEFYNGKKYIKAIDIQKGDNIIYFGTKPNIIINEDIKQLILSGILGDGHIQNVRTKARIKFSCIHKEYITLKKNILNVIEDNNIIKIINKGYKRNHIYVYNSNIYSDLSYYKHKDIQFVLNNLNDFGLAMWFYDDGSFGKNYGALNTQSFSLNDNKLISEFFNKKGFVNNVQREEKKDGRIFYYIRFLKSGTIMAHSIMRKYPLKCFEYKYNFMDEKNINYFKYSCDKLLNIDSLNNIFLNYKRSDKKPSIVKCISKKIIYDEDFVYDIEVEDNHNFIANNLLVHNCHNYATKRLLEYVKQPCKYKIGLTATLKRMDDKHYDLMKMFDYNIFKYAAEEALFDGVLNPFIFVNVGLDLDSETTTEYDVLTQQLNAIFVSGGSYKGIMRGNNPLKFKMLALINKRKEIVNNYIEKFDIATKIILKHKDNKIIVFNQYNSQTSKLYWYLIEYGIDCRVIHSGITKDKREQAIMDFKNDKFNVLLTTKVLDEGMNIPKLDVAIIMAGDSTDKQTVQRMGRVLRKKKGQDSMLYQIYCKNTIEEKSAIERAKLFKRLSSDYKDIMYKKDKTVF